MVTPVVAEAFSTTLAFDPFFTIKILLVPGPTMFLVTPGLPVTDRIAYRDVLGH